MNSASLDRSARLKRVSKFLSDKKEHSTYEIVQKTKVCAVNSIVSELRDNGLDIRCQRRGDRWYYRMVA
jgi:hypothetical protein